MLLRVIYKQLSVQLETALKKLHDAVNCLPKKEGRGWELFSEETPSGSILVPDGDHHILL